MTKPVSARTIILATTLLLQLGTLCFHSRGAAGDVDLFFAPGLGVNYPVDGIAMQPDGKVLIGGLFTFVSGTNRCGGARLNADGSLDGTFISTGFNPALGDHDGIGSAAVQPDGKVLISGFTYFSECTETPYYPYYYCWIAGVSSFLTRFNADGSQDTSFAGTANGVVRSITLQPDGRVLIGGDFSAVNGTNRYGIARLNANGTLDSSFNPGAWINGYVTAIALQSDGKVIIAGYFSGANATNRNGVARLNANGSLDASFDPGAGAGGGLSGYEVKSVVAQPDGKVLIGGYFSAVNGTNRNGIARLNADGGLDGSFNPGTGADGSVRCVALQSDGNVLIGGEFHTVNGVMRRYVARLYGNSVAPSPSLNITRSNAFVIVSWPVTGLNIHLQESTNLSLPNSWSPVAQVAVTNANEVSVTVPTTAPRKFFRLTSP
jgi:uncharacterized delta-60 repeat protein